MTQQCRFPGCPRSATTENKGRPVCAEHDAYAREMEGSAPSTDKPCASTYWRNRYYSLGPAYSTTPAVEYSPRAVSAFCRAARKR